MANNNGNKRRSSQESQGDKRQKSLLDDSHLMDLVQSEIDPILAPSHANSNSNANNEEDEEDREEEEDGEGEEILFDTLEYPSTGQVSNAFQRKQVNKLSELLKDVNRQLPQSVKINQNAALKRISKAESTIDMLRRENMALKNRIKLEKVQTSNLKREHSHLEKGYQSDISRLQSIIDDARELETQFSLRIKELEGSDNQHNQIDTNLELRSGLIQVLTGLNCYQLEEDEESLYFSINQTSVHAQMNYQLVINKDNGESSDVLFIPDWEKPTNFNGTDESWDQNVTTIKSLLPDYLHSDLIFSSDTLHSFYLKISRCLKKDEK